MPYDDLLLLASPHTDPFEVLELFPGRSSVEVRLDRRRRARREAAAMHAPGEDRRRSDRRNADVTDELRTVGWVFIPLAQRA